MLVGWSFILEAAGLVVGRLCFPRALSWPSPDVCVRGMFPSPDSTFAGDCCAGSDSVPFCLHSGLYWRVWHMDLIQSAVLYSVMTLISTYLVAFAYKNVKFVLKHK